MLQETQTSSVKNWRKNWFVVNVLVEIPIFGSFFKIEQMNHAMHDAGKCVASLIGGTVTMMVSTQNENNHAKAQTLLMVGSMTLGMTASKVFYNGLCSGGTMLYKYRANQAIHNEMIDSDNAEREAIILASMHDIEKYPNPATIKSDVRTPSLSI